MSYYKLLLIVISEIAVVGNFLFALHSYQLYHMLDLVTDIRHTLNMVVADWKVIDCHVVVCSHAASGI